ncbi:MAG TPA: FAD-dependent oxidoreductase [Thermomicrobiales bacterium]|nr:FAD-dependent oxidoreductase [Thermomicrobiales bacterium]
MVYLQPVNTPHSKSLWLQEALELEPCAEDAEPLQGSHVTDICIVGGGYTGLWTALRIKELDPSVSVTLLEAKICGSGASGRNGGMIGCWWDKLGTLLKVCGTDDGLFMAQAAYDAIGEIEQFLRENQIEAHFVRKGRLQVATSEFQLGSWEPARQMAEKLGYGWYYTPLTRDEIQRRGGSPHYIGGSYRNGDATVQPALLARGLRKVAIERGVQIFENTPVTQIHEGDPVILCIPNGAVMARKVVLATNAWTAAIPELRRQMIVVSSDIVTTTPIPDRLETIGWTGGESIADSRIMVHYMHVTHDKRISIGRGSGALAYLGRVTPAFDGNPAKAKVVEQGLRKFYPMLPDVPITHSWGGPIDRSRSGTFIFGRLTGSPNIAYGVGYSGSGVGQSVVGGKILASTALDRVDEWSTSRLNQGSVILYPPDPVKFFAGIAVRGVLTHREEGEEDGRAPHPVVKAISKLAYPTLPKRLDRSKSTPKA